MVLQKDDCRFMAASIRLARQHLGLTAENPSVGALVVQTIGSAKVIVGRGVTACGGRPHAEPQALEEAGEKAIGSTVYVTLEPCSHIGKTPPCVDSLIKAKVGRVVIALRDPDCRVSGRGIEKLKSAGIQVDVSIAKELAINGLEGYLSLKLRQRPWVTLKLALSKENAIGIKGQGKVAISNTVSQMRSQMMRVEYDAILIGVETALVDNPLLSCRLDGLASRSPQRVVLDRKLRIPLDSALVKTAYKIPLIIFCHMHVDANKVEALEKAGCFVIPIDKIESEDFLGAILSRLSERDISSVLVEGGAKIAQAFKQAGFIDRLGLFQSNTVLDGELIYAPSIESLTKNMHIEERRLYGQDIYTQWTGTGLCLPE